MPAALIERANAFLRVRFGLPAAARPVRGFWNPSLFLDEELLRDQGLDVGEVEELLATELERVPGVARAFGKRALLAGDVDGGRLTTLVTNSVHPVRSGGVLLVQNAGWFLYREPFGDAAMHGSPYRYDTHVPVLFRVPGGTPRTVLRGVGPEDVAPTLAALLGVEAPSAAAGEILAEVLP